MSLDSQGPCNQATLTGIINLVNMLLASGEDPDVIIDQLRGGGCGHPHWDRGCLVTSMGDGAARLLAAYFGKEY